jgi:hypothetical protein
MVHVDLRSDTETDRVHGEGKAMIGAANPHRAEEICEMKMALEYLMHDVDWNEETHIGIRKAKKSHDVEEKLDEKRMSTNGDVSVMCRGEETGP